MKKLSKEDKVKRAAIACAIELQRLSPKTNQKVESGPLGYIISNSDVMILVTDRCK